MEEEFFAGGNSNTVTRIGGRFYRDAGPWTPAVHQLLALLHAAGIKNVPEPIGFDDQGKEILSFLPGDVAHYPLPQWLWTPEILGDAGKLLRKIHDASVPLVNEPLVWGMETHQPAEVICHNDVAPYNMTFINGKLSGLFDFDTASPGPRVWDLAYLAYRLVPFAGDAEDCNLSTEERLLRLDRLIAAYGRPFSRREVFATLAVRLDELARYTENRAAETGDREFLKHAEMYCSDRVKVVLLNE